MIMKKVSYLLLSTVVLFSGMAVAQPLFDISQNVYRVPYANGTDVEVSRDHYTHSPTQGRYDMHGEGLWASCTVNYMLVAAAAGVVRRVVDHHDVHGPDCTSNCEDYNNYVWIEHANGEWTKYTHMVRFSASGLAGLQEGDCISAGQFLGYECEIGHASGPHLHFEVRRPNDPDNVQISVAGGFMTDAAHLIPAVCGVSRNFFQDGDDFTAASCGSCNPALIFNYTNQTFIPDQVYVKIAGGTITTGSNVTFSNRSSTLLQSNVSITFQPGLTVTAGSYFNARIGSCGTTAFNGTCN
jgi:murein DD-endopeptidase MepM/ murein hydrolase activator NlpD